MLSRHKGTTFHRLALPLSSLKYFTGFVSFERIAAMFLCRCCGESLSIYFRKWQRKPF